MVHLQSLIHTDSCSIIISSNRHIFPPAFICFHSMSLIFLLLHISIIPANNIPCNVNFQYSAAPKHTSNYWIAIWENGGVSKTHIYYYHDSHKQKAPLKKSIYSLYQLFTIMKAANYRYLEFISSFNDHSNGNKNLTKVTSPVVENERSYRGLNFFAENKITYVKTFNHTVINASYTPCAIVIDNSVQFLILTLHVQKIAPMIAVKNNCIILPPRK